MGQNPYQCSQGNKAFKLKQGIKAHQRTHTDKKLYQCNQCNKDFALECNLQVHQRTDTDEKPYK